MIKITEEMEQKLRQAETLEDVKQILSEGKYKFTPDQIEQVYNELQQKYRGKDEELSLDELEMVSGGKDLNWIEDGCYATVEGSSWCGRNDKCEWLWTTYDYAPVKYKCVDCGVWLHEIYDDSYIISCHICGRMYSYNDFK